MEQEKVYQASAVSFSGCDVLVQVNGVNVSANAFEVYKKTNLSQEDFCRLVPELVNSTLDSIKNLDGIMVLEHLILGEELEIPNGSDITLHFGNEYGNRAIKEIKDVHVVKRCMAMNTDSFALIELIVLACGEVGPYKRLPNVEVE